MRSDHVLWILLGILATACLLLMLNNDAGQSFGFDNSDIARIVTAMLLLFFIGGGLLMRSSGGELLRNSAIWLAIIVALVVGYRLYEGEPVFPTGQPAAVESGTGVSI